MREFVCVTCRDYSEIVRPTLEEKVLRPCAVLLLSGSQPQHEIFKLTGLYQNQKWCANYVNCIHTFFLEATILSAG